MIVNSFVLLVRKLMLYRFFGRKLTHYFMKITNIILLLVISTLFACNPVAEKESDLKVVVLKESKDILPISSFVSKVDYLELKVAEAGIEMGEIEDVKLVGDHLLVKHRMSGRHGFLRFTKNGDFVIEIVGAKTPRIRNPKDVIAYKDGFAVLADNGIHAVSSDGKYLQQLVRGPMPGARFFYADNAFQVVNEQGLGTMRIAFPSAEKGAKKPEHLPKLLQRNTYAGIEDFGKDGTHYYSVLSDTVYNYSNGADRPLYVLTGDEMPTFAQVCAQVPDVNEKGLLKYLRETEHVIVRKYFENKHYLYLKYWVGSDPTTVLVDKKSGKIRYFGYGVNDVDGGIWDEAFLLTDRNELYVPITAYKISGHKISNTKVKGFDRLQARIAASGNPVIMRCKLR